jgi:hypothetical protein
MYKPRPFGIVALARNVGTFPARVDVLPQLWPGARPGDLRQHPHDVALDGADIGFDILEGTGRDVAVEIAVEVDLVADDATRPSCAICLLAAHI